MKVKELINLLRVFDPERSVEVFTLQGAGSNALWDQEKVMDVLLTKNGEVLLTTESTDEFKIDYVRSS